MIFCNLAGDAFKKRVKYKGILWSLTVYIFIGLVLFSMDMSQTDGLQAILVIIIKYMFFMVGTLLLMVGLWKAGNKIQNEDRTQQLLLASEKLAIAGQLAAGIAHEIRNPLTSLKGFLQLMQSGRSSKEEYYAIMASELNRIELILTELLVLAKPQQQAAMLPEDMIDLINQVIVLLNTQASLNNIQLITDFKVEALKVKCNENQIKQVFINLVKNAIDSMPKGGEIIIKVDKLEKHANIMFIDSGYGIPQDKLIKMGEPFYSTKEEGNGLGLMVSFKIIENHGGTIIIHSKVGEGTTFEVGLPLSG